MDPPKNEDIKDDEEESEQHGDKKDTSKQLPQDWIVTKEYLLDNILRDIKKSKHVFI